MTADATNPPVARFRRFERVTLEAHERLGPSYPERTGTVLWCDPPQKTSGPRQWHYCVFLHSSGGHRTFLESELRSTGQFDSAETYLGAGFEISHDLSPNDDGTFDFVEGTYRLPGRFWEVIVFGKWDVPELRHRRMTWDSGITGTAFYVPRDERLDKPYVERAMSDVFGTNHWVEVRGPDSMVLR